MFMSFTGDRNDLISVGDFSKYQIELGQKGVPHDFGTNESGYAILICWDEYAVLDRKLDTPYPMEVDTPYSTVDQNSLGFGWIRGIQVLDTAYWGFLGVGTTLDIFQNITLIPYFEYGVLSLSGYDILSLFLCGLCRIDTAYSLNEYSVFDTGLNTAYPGDLGEKKKSTMLVKVST
ncbi:hypothetical protein Tco_1060510, partial [Tanacetum coccineum]